jgi:adenosine 3'-phospho 5'-phosphosulfate transporter B2
LGKQLPLRCLQEDLSPRSPFRGAGHSVFAVETQLSPMQIYLHETTMSSTSLDWRMFAFGIAMQLTMVAYGFFQELLTGHGHRMHELEQRHPIPPAFFVIANRLGCSIVAWLGIVIARRRSGGGGCGGGALGKDAVGEGPSPPLSAILISALALTVDGVLRYAALRRIPFSAMLVMRGFVVFPSLIFGHCLGARSSTRDWVMTIPIAAGVMIFGSDSPAWRASEHDHAGRLIIISGIAMATAAMVADGFNAQWQSRLFRVYNGTSPQALLLRISLCGVGISVAGVVLSGETVDIINALAEDPAALWYVLGMTISSSLGSVVIFEVLERYGGFVLAIMALVRRLISVGLSCYIFSRPLTSSQILGIVIVFGTLFVRSLFRIPTELETSTSPPSAISPRRSGAGRSPKVSPEQRDSRSALDNLEEGAHPMTTTLRAIMTGSTNFKSPTPPNSGRSSDSVGAFGGGQMRFMRGAATGGSSSSNV